MVNGENALQLSGLSNTSGSILSLMVAKCGYLMACTIMRSMLVLNSAKFALLNSLSINDKP
jgi:hypothetical protein